jgi:hypothetical protein
MQTFPIGGVKTLGAYDARKETKNGELRKHYKKDCNPAGGVNSMSMNGKTRTKRVIGSIHWVFVLGPSLVIGSWSLVIAKGGQLAWEHLDKTSETRGSDADIDNEGASPLAASLCGW